MRTSSGQALKDAIVLSGASAPVTMPTPAHCWAGILLAWTAELRHSTGSERTPTEYGRYAEHFRKLLAG